MVQEISIQELMQRKKEKKIVTVDVRSQAEFEEATIPGSVNIPLFDNDERAEIGTIYKQISVEAAKDRGLEVVSAKLPSFIREVASIKEHKAVFCWRGGMRSRTTAALLDLMGIRVYRVTGGYRAYRNWVVDRLNAYRLPERAYVINGNTGTGKTRILRSLLAQGYPTVDLEGMAGHRGSIFGEIGLKANNQKMFDSLLLQRLDEIGNAPCLIMEGESQRIGKVLLPHFVVSKKEEGMQIFIDMPIEERVRNILSEYQPSMHKNEYLTAYAKIKRRIHTPIANEIETSIQAEQYETAVRLLLEHYYDPRYEHTMEQYREDQIIRLHVQDAAQAEARIRAIITDK